MSDYYYPKMHEADDGIIEINVIRVPRWKESELSGDEWRFSLRGVINFKNWTEGGTSQKVIGPAADLPEIALKVAAWCVENRRLLSPPFTVQSLAEMVVCFQPGCDARPENVYRIKQEWTWHPHQGYHMGPRAHPVIRAFCGRHSHRGDCGLEDSDANYELLAFFPQMEEARREP